MMQRDNLNGTSMRVVVILQALNEAVSIGNVIGAIKQQGYECILVDDGSVDGTPEIARSQGIEVLQHIINLGQGFAVLTGFKASLARGFDVIVQMDADGQHDPAQIPLFLAQLEKSGADIVVGSRILGTNHPDAPFLRRTFLPFYTWVINMLTGYRMTDAMCGLRAFRASALKKAIRTFDHMLEPQYLAAEMFIRFSKLGLTVDEVPIHMRDRASGISYKGTLRYGVGVFRAMVRTLVDKNYRLSGEVR